ncbi:hypothetical protein ACFFLM_03270 [Deinococcus oregonensis]|uniref:FHA domain-containing protein n=1 Tax=Deinococcus oregonensis TaxID=1805970 RepID=A0ABV6AU27_9DEIO
MITTATHQETSTAPLPSEPTALMFFDAFDRPNLANGRRPVVRVGRADRRDDGTLMVSSPSEILLQRGRVFLLNCEPGGVFSDQETRLGIYARSMNGNGEPTGPEVRVGTALLSACRRRWSLTFGANCSSQKMICRPIRKAKT